MSQLFPANRVAALAAFLTGLGTALAGLEGSLSTGAANAVATGVGVLGAIVTVLQFMNGSQKWDALTAGAAGEEYAPQGEYPPPGEYTPGEEPVA